MIKMELGLTLDEMLIEELLKCCDGTPCKRCVLGAADVLHESSRCLLVLKASAKGLSLPVGYSRYPRDKAVKLYEKYKNKIIKEENA